MEGLYRLPSRRRERNVRPAAMANGFVRIVLLDSERFIRSRIPVTCRAVCSPQPVDTKWRKHGIVECAGTQDVGDRDRDVVNHRVCLILKSVIVFRGFAHTWIVKSLTAEPSEY
jgi:hypothetical protein